MQVGAATDVGKVRSMNQDFYYCSREGRTPYFYIVADGMGGHNGGEVASKISVNIIKDFVMEHYKEEDYVQNRLLLVKDALARANKEVFRISVEKEELRGMGTTLSMAFIEEQRLYTGHIGDSRIYLIREGKAEKITEDHSLVAELLKNGRITPEEADIHPQRNIITRALGTQCHVEIDLGVRDLREGDMLLLCTDGLSNMLSCREIENLCGTIDDPQVLCDRLVEEANLRGGKDNITVVAVKVRWRY